MRIGTLRFRPGVRLTLIASALVALFVQLGIWQLHRAEQKEELKAAIETILHELPE